MKIMMAKQGIERNEAFERTAQPAGKEYFSKFKRIIKDSGKSKSPVHIIFLDKNHPPNGIQKAVQTIDESISKDVIIKKLYLVPDIKQTMP
jgi:deoxyadenosine/deoxycytidine kinase